MADIPSILDFNFRLRTQLFTSSGSFVVGTGVGWLWVDGTGGGAGGGGGNSTPGGGGGGGGAGNPVKKFLIAVTPGSTLTVTIGAAGAGGAINGAGVTGGDTIIAGILDQYGNAVNQINLKGGVAGSAGANPNGGNGGANRLTGIPAGGAGIGVTSQYPNATLSIALGAVATSGSAGGALNFAGGSPVSAAPWSAFGASSTGNASGGGGGVGGWSEYGEGGLGGSNGAAGASGNGYGSGGGGGSGNSAGAAGMPGFVRFYWYE